MLIKQTKYRICQKLGSRDLWPIANRVLNESKCSKIYLLYSTTQRCCLLQSVKQNYFLNIFPALYSWWLWRKSTCLKELISTLQSVTFGQKRHLKTKKYVLAYRLHSVDLMRSLKCNGKNLNSHFNGLLLKKASHLSIYRAFSLLELFWNWLAFLQLPSWWKRPKLTLICLRYLVLIVFQRWV